MSRAKSVTQQGFTLIELVVVIVILGILAAFAIPRFINISAEARVSAVNGMGGSLRSTSALLHGMALAQNNPGNTAINLEGSSVAMVNHYPTAAVTGIGNAMSNIDGFTPTIDCDGAITTTHICFTPVSITAPSLTCSTIYIQATATVAASVQTRITNCS